jgi:hypothetical protein
MASEALTTSDLEQKYTQLLEKRIAQLELLVSKTAETQEAEGKKDGEKKVDDSSDGIGLSRKTSQEKVSYYF